jgi:hypothetical protein
MAEPEGPFPTAAKLVAKKYKVEWRTLKDFHLRRGKCCGSCFHATFDQDQPMSVWCENYKGPSGMIGAFHICDLYNSAKQNYKG